MLNLDNYPEVLTIKEVAEILRTGEQTVSDYIHRQNNSLPAIKLTHMTWRITKQQLTEWLESQVKEV